MSDLIRAIQLAQQYHGEQSDKGGQPFIGHPLRVMAKVSIAKIGLGDLRTRQDLLMIAVMHDLVEDTEVTLGDLINLGFSERVVIAVDALTRRDNESYWQYLERVKVNPLAVIVKLADLEDNVDPRRTRPEGLKIWARYERALEMLQGV